jgi:hypothetical protein
MSTCRHWRHQSRNPRISTPKLASAVKPQSAATLKALVSTQAWRTSLEVLVESNWNSGRPAFRNECQDDGPHSPFPLPSSDRDLQSVWVPIHCTMLPLQVPTPDILSASDPLQKNILPFVVQGLGIATWKMSAKMGNLFVRTQFQLHL